MRTHKIEIVFPVGIDFPDGFEQALDSLINMVCEQYQRENPTQVMWTSGHGSMPIWNEPHEPTFDDSVYQIEVAEREDINGNNPYNPNRDELRRKRHEERQAKKKKKKGEESALQH